MRPAIGPQWRILLRSPALWFGPPVLVAAAVLLMPVNEGYHLYWVNFDPQGDDQYYEKYYTDGIFTHTSGFLVGHLIALLLGAALVLADHAPARLAERARTGADPRRVLAGKLVVAAVAGAGLALLNAAVSIPLASARLGAPPAPAAVRAAGLSFDPDLLSDPGVRLTIAVGLAMFPLLAAVGVGLGALVATWSRLCAVLVLWALAMLVVGTVFGFEAHGDPVVLFVLLLLGLPISGYVAILWGATSAHLTGGVPSGYGVLAAVAALAGGLGYAVLGYHLGAVALRRRLAGTTGSPQGQELRND